MNLSSETDGRLKSLQVEFATRGIARIAIELLLCVALCVTGLVGNTIVLWVVVKKMNEGKMIFLFIGSLAVSDILLLSFTTYLVPAVLVHGKWPSSHSVCQFQGAHVVFLGSASLHLMAATAVNRYFRVVRTNYYRLLFTAKRTKLLICGCWVFASTVPIQYLVSGERYSFHPGKCSCFQTVELKPSMLYFYANISIPICVITFSYYRIFKSVRSHQARVTSMKQNSNTSICRPNIQDIKITHTLFLTVIGFVCCWVPIAVIDITDYVKGAFTLPREVYFLYGFLGVTSSVVNPVIYGAMNPMFRQEYKNVLRLRCCVRSQAEDVE